MNIYTHSQNVKALIMQEFIAQFYIRIFSYNIKSAALPCIMNTIINKSIFFPRISESNANLEKMTKAHQIKHQILTDIVRNDVASLYRLNGEPKYASVCTVRKTIASKGQRKVIKVQDKRVSPYKISKKVQDQGLSRRHSICISDLSNDYPPFIVKRLNHDHEITSIRQSLEKIRNNLKLKLLRFKTQLNSEDKEQRSAKEHSQFNQIFSIRSISKSMKANHALQYRFQAKKFFRPQPQPVKLIPPSFEQRLCNPRLNELKMTSINGWVIDEQDISLSNNMNNSSRGQKASQQ